MGIMFSQMTKNAARLCFGLALAVSPTERAFAENTNIPIQKNPPSACAGGDKDCILRSYAEYKDAILAEFRAYKRLEPKVYTLARQAPTDAALPLQAQIMQEGLYVHNHWKTVDPLKVQDAGVPYDEAETILGTCRTAIITLKFIIIGISSGPGRLDDDLASWKSDSAACAKRAGKSR